MGGPRDERAGFVQYVVRGLEDGDEDTRWKCASVIEELVVWEPGILPQSLLESMARDTPFAVRSSAAVCFYLLARLDPVSVPLDVLCQLADPGEDWYVQTPATSAPLRLARSRPVVVNVWMKRLPSKQPAAREQAAHALARLAEVDWDLVPDNAFKEMAASPDRAVRSWARRGAAALAKARRWSPHADYAPF